MSLAVTSGLDLPVFTGCRADRRLEAARAKVRWAVESIFIRTARGFQEDFQSLLSIKFRVVRQGEYLHQSCTNDTTRPPKACTSRETAGGLGETGDGYLFRVCRGHRMRHERLPASRKNLLMVFQ